MACKVVEMAKPKCERYWPEVNQTMKIGAIQVTTVSGGRERERERERERDAKSSSLTCTLLPTVE